MFYKWFRTLNKNWRTILATIVIVAFFVILLQTAFSIIRNTKNKQLEKQQSSVNYANELSNTQNDSNINYSSDTRVEKNTLNVLEQFVNYCNQKQTTEAYAMISDDCKKELYPTVQNFQTNYIQTIFSQFRSAKIEQSIYDSKIYKITYYADLLSNGGYSSNNTFQDYIYFTQQNGETKLNINKFLYTEQINKTASRNNIYANIVKKDTYVEFETYQIQFTNQSNHTVLLYSPNENSKVVLVDKNNIEYSSNMDEQPKERIVIAPYTTSVLTIKFNKMYNSERKNNKAIEFINVITNYEKYQTGEELEKITFQVAI